jgi:hypothetical protein
MASHYKSVYERDKKWIMQFEVATLEKFAWPLLIGFICLNFLDVYSTTLAMTKAGLFHEENPIASVLFNHQFQGYLVAIVFKYLPLIPFFFIVFVRDRSGRHEVQIRIIKFSAVVALAGADVLLFYIVGIHNLQSLLALA